MREKISLIQMDVRLGEPEVNFARAAALMEEAMAEAPDILVLPETVNVGFSRRRRENWRRSPMKRDGGQRKSSEISRRPAA